MQEQNSQLGVQLQNFTVQSLIKGAENLNMYNLISVGTRRVINLPLLKIIGHQIENLIGQHIVN